MTTVTERPLAIVTGASSGIGYELAKQFATNGFDLVVAAEDAPIADAARDFEKLGARVEAVRVDLADGAGVQRLYSTATASGRAVDAVRSRTSCGWST